MTYKAPEFNLAQFLPSQKISRSAQSVIKAVTMGVIEAIAFCAVWPLAPQSDFLALASLWLIWFVFVKKAYSQRLPLWDELQRLARKSIHFVFALAIITGVTPSFSKAFDYGLLAVALFSSILLGRLASRFLLNQLGLWQQSAVIFGGGANATQAMHALHKERWLGMQVKAFLIPGETNQPVLGSIQGIPCVSWSDTPENWEALSRIHCVAALESDEHGKRDRVIKRLMQHRVPDIKVIPAMRGVPLYDAEITHFFSNELLCLTLPNNLAKPHLRLIKRLFDLVGASLAIILASPLMLWVAWKIWRESPGPVIFSQPRVGSNGKLFKFYKFRSMLQNAEDVLSQWESENSPEWQAYVANNFKLANDPRVLHIGKTIRATSIDELPQLFNVLRGDMSLVGPRPLLAREVAEYGDTIQLYSEVRPGLTGLWQVSGRSKTSFAEREMYDVWYIKNWSLWADIAILSRTVRTVLVRDGAF